MTGTFLDVAIAVAIGVLIIAGTLAVVRLLRGPTLLDRVVALDLLSVLVVAMITVAAIQSDQPALIDVALAMALVAFLSTIAFARFIEERRRHDEGE